MTMEHILCQYQCRRRAKVCRKYCMLTGRELILCPVELVLRKRVVRQRYCLLMLMELMIFAVRRSAGSPPEVLCCLLYVPVILDLWGVGRASVPCSFREDAKHHGVIRIPPE